MTKASPSLGPGIDPPTRRFLEHVKEQADVLSGHRGSPLDRALTPRDLLDLGLAKLIGDRAQRIISGRNFVPSTPAPNLSAPPKPTGFTVQDGFASVFLTWDVATEAYSNHSYTLVYRNTVDNLATATVIAQTPVGFVYADNDVQFGTTYYYWIRFVSTSGVEGPYNSSVGTQGKIVEDPSELLARLNGSISETQLHHDLNARIDGLDNQYTVKIGQDGAIAGFGLAFTGPDYDPKNPNHSIAIFNVNTFAVGAPGASNFGLVVHDNGDGTQRVAMDAASIVNLTVTNAMIDNVSASKITTGTVTASVTMNAAHINGGSLSINNKFIVDENGNVTIRNATTGARLEVRNDVIKVYDETGTLRVRIGNLLA